MKASAKKQFLGKVVLLSVAVFFLSIVLYVSAPALFLEKTSKSSTVQIEGEGDFIDESSTNEQQISEEVDFIGKVYTEAKKILTSSNNQSSQGTTTKNNTSSSGGSSSGGSSSSGSSSGGSSTPTSTCPSSTQNCIPCSTVPGSTSPKYYSDCRVESGDTTGYRGWSCQNNNPGNIRNASSNLSTDFKNIMIANNGGTPACGIRYDSRGGSYFIFSSYNAGIGALKAYVKGINNGQHSAYTGCGNCTIKFFFSKYAPGDPNYDNAVGADLGVDPETTTISWVVSNKLDAFVAAIKKHEGWFIQ